MRNHIYESHDCWTCHLSDWDKLVDWDLSERVSFNIFSCIALYQLKGV